MNINTIVDRFPIKFSPLQQSKDNSRQKIVKRKKQWRAEFWGREQLMNFVKVDQQSHEWFEARNLQFGASQLGIICGVSKYVSIASQFELDLGLLAYDEKQFSPNQLMSMHAGHILEPEAIELYKNIMQTKTMTTGINFHPFYPFVHASIDMAIENPNKKWNQNSYIAQDESHIIGEIKCPAYRVYSTTDGKFPTVPLMYMVQMIVQMNCMHRYCCDFVVYYKARLQPNSDANKLQLIGQNQWKIGELQITRVYNSAHNFQLIMQKLFAYMTALEQSTPPSKQCFSTDMHQWQNQVIVPLKWLVFYVESAESPWDATSGAILPDLEIKTRTIHDYSIQKPLSMSWANLDSCKSNYVELDRIPVACREIDIAQVKNPLYASEINDLAKKIWDINFEA